jgi:hypothetical protein
MRNLCLLPLATTFILTLAGCGGSTTAGSSTSTSSSSATSSTGSGIGGAGGAGGAGTSSSSSASAGTGGSQSSTVAIAGTVVPVPQGTLPGVSICLLDHPEVPCVTSDGQGKFSIDVPANAEVAITLSKAGFAGVLVPIATSDKDQLQWAIGLQQEPDVKGFYDASPGATYPDANHGFLAVFAHPSANPQAGLPGMTASITPVSGTGPFYASPNFKLPDPMLTSTSTSGIVRFADVAPGMLEITAGPATLVCTSNFGGWPSPKANTLRAPIAPGFETHVGVECSTPP